MLRFQKIITQDELDAALRAENWPDAEAADGARMAFLGLRGDDNLMQELAAQVVAARLIRAKDPTWFSFYD